MNRIDKLSTLLESRGMATCFFDMGRRIGMIPGEDISAIEAGQKPYPYPLLRAAWFAVLHHGAAAMDSIWFLRLPVDEQGMLIPATRDDLLFHLLEDLGRHADDSADTGADGITGSGIGQRNPYGFKPRQEHLAVFHAKTARQLGQPPSRFYAHAREYLGGTQGYEQWAFVGLQGIADVCARLDEDDNRELLLEAITRLPARPLEAVCQCLEHQAIDRPVAEALIRRIREPVDASEPEAPLLALCIRAISACRDPGVPRALVASSLEQEPAGDPEVLAAIMARYWEVLQDPAIRRVYLQRLAGNTGGQPVFNAVIGDALGLPGLRDDIQAELRNPERTEALARAIGGLFYAVRNGP